MAQHEVICSKYRALLVVLHTLMHATPGSLPNGRSYLYPPSSTSTTLPPASSSSPWVRAAYPNGVTD